MNEHSTADLGERMQEIGKRLTIGLTVPMFLVIIGFLTAPIGLVFWILAAVLFATLFQPYGKTATKTDTNDQATH